MRWPSERITVPNVNGRSTHMCRKVWWSLFRPAHVELNMLNWTCFQLLVIAGVQAQKCCIEELLDFCGGPSLCCFSIAAPTSLRVLSRFCPHNDLESLKDVLTAAIPLWFFVNHPLNFCQSHKGHCWGTFWNWAYISFCLEPNLWQWMKWSCRDQLISCGPRA